MMPHVAPGICRDIPRLFHSTHMLHERPLPRDRDCVR